jgi:hypothetical protein
MSAYVSLEDDGSDSVYFSDCSDCDEDDGDFAAAAHADETARAKRALNKCRLHSKNVEAELERLKIEFAESRLHPVCEDDGWTLAALATETSKKKHAESQAEFFRRRSMDAESRATYMEKNCITAR